jgi:spermidine synthase
MTATVPNVSRGEAPRYLPLILLLFAGSGCSALIYEIVWFQLLQLAIGSTTVSLAILLTVFMGGLCIGSIGLPRLFSARHHPLRIYAAVELGIGVCGLLAVVGIPLISRMYWSWAGGGLTGMLLRGLIAGIALLPPTILMGASLPAIVRWVESSPRGISWWALLYGGNTLGAVFGCLLAGFYLLRIYDVAVATYAAVAINVVVAVLSFLLATQGEAVGATSTDEEPAPEPGAGMVYFVIAVSGACALGAEVVWTRLMGMMLGSTVYVFSIILAVFLTGLAGGSAAASALIRRMRDSLPARVALGWCQLLLVLGIAWTAYMIAEALPYWNATPLLDSNPGVTFRADLFRCFCALLPSTLLWGASFPLACAAIASPERDSGKLVGGIYAANTLGCIVGALGVSLILVPWIGTQQSQRVLLVLSAVAGWAIVVPHLWKRRSPALAAAIAVVSLAATGFLAWRVHAIPGQVIAYGRRVTISGASSTLLYTKEGINSSVAITQWNDGAYEIDVNGHVEATTEPFDMKLQRMVGHLPGILHPDPKSVLGIGFGAGVSAGTFTRYPGIQKITICEIEPIIPPTSTRYFGPQDYRVMLNPKTHIVYDDARHYVLTTPDKFDIIASDPLDVFVKGTAAIYSKEYFESVKQHLKPGGMFTLYVPLYESDFTTVKSELATFFAVFPHGTIWANTVDGQGYDMVFMGQDGPLQIDLDAVEQRLERADYSPVRQSLREIGLNSAIDLMATYAGQRSDLEPWIRGVPINRDRDLKLQYLAGWGINSQLADPIYRQIMSFRRPPSNLFTGSPRLLTSLSSALYSAQ